jgi:hypothetical protein
MDPLLYKRKRVVRLNTEEWRPDLDVRISLTGGVSWRCGNTVEMAGCDPLLE